MGPSSTKKTNSCVLSWLLPLCASSREPVNGKAVSMSGPPHQPRTVYTGPEVMILG